MTIPTGFIDAICRDPDDLTPRLVAADWLEEHGDTARAEFIRVQCELAELLDGVQPHHHHSLDMICDPDSPEDQAWKHRVWKLQERERELSWITSHSDHCFGLLPLPDDWTFRRGFVEEVACSKQLWLEHGPRIVRAAPIRVVRVTDVKPWQTINLYSLTTESHHRVSEHGNEDDSVFPEEWTDYMPQKSRTRWHHSLTKGSYWLKSPDDPLSDLFSAALAWARKEAEYE